MKKISIEDSDEVNVPFEQSGFVLTFIAIGISRKEKDSFFIDLNLEEL